MTSNFGPPISIAGGGTAHGACHDPIVTIASSAVPNNSPARNAVPTHTIASSKSPSIASSYALLTPSYVPVIACHGRPAICAMKYTGCGPATTSWICVVSEPQAANPTTNSNARTSLHYSITTSLIGRTPSPAG